MKKKPVLSAFLVLCLSSLSFTPAGASSDDEDSDSSTESPRARRSSQAAGSTSSTQTAAATKEGTEEALQDEPAASSTIPPEGVAVEKPEAPRAGSPVSSSGEASSFSTNPAEKKIKEGVEDSATTSSTVPPAGVAEESVAPASVPAASAEESAQASTITTHPSESLSSAAHPPLPANIGPSRPYLLLHAYRSLEEFLFTHTSSSIRDRPRNIRTFIAGFWTDFPPIKQLLCQLVATEVELAKELESVEHFSYPFESQKKSLLEHCTTPDQLFAWGGLHRKWSDFRGVLIERFYLLYPEYKVFADRFKSKLYAIFTAWQVLSTGLVSQEPSPREKFIKAIGTVLSFSPVFGSQALALSNLIGDTPDAIQKVVEISCTTTDLLSKAPDLKELCEMGQDLSQSHYEVISRLTDPHAMQAEIDATTLLMMGRYCHGKYWDSIVKTAYPPAKDTNVTYIKRMADFAIKRILKLVKKRKQMITSTSPLSLQLVDGVRLVCLDQEPFLKTITKIFGKKTDLDTNSSEMGCLDDTDTYVYAWDYTRSLVHHPFYEWHLFHRESMRGISDKESHDLPPELDPNKNPAFVWNTYSLHT